MTHKHLLPQALKEKIKSDVETINRLKSELQGLDKAMQDVIAAYIMGAGIPQTNIRFDEEFNLLYEDGIEQNYEVEEVEDLDVEFTPTQSVSSEDRAPKPRVR